ncbi:MAG: MFS transporter [Desulfamplus sp.]|nr:MFS transporter [Desulfamplus sp.]MBF0209539.1 MFS transporter [Desulfamplus sp.]
MNNSKSYLTTTLWVIASVQFLTPFMFSAVGVALPAIGKEFNAGAVHLGLIEMVYILGVAMFLLPAGRFADINGRKKIFLSGSFFMILTTIAVSLASNIQLLILFRLFQGACAAMITSTSFAMLTSIFPPERRGRAIGVVVSAVYLGISAGPTLAGLMVQYLNWRWIFYCAVIVEVAAFLFALTRLKGEWAEAKGERFDWFGSLIYMVSLASIIIGVVELKELDYAKWFAFCGSLGMLLFFIYELRVESPLLPLKKIVTNKIFMFSNLATWLNYAASFGLTFFFSIYLQVVRGVSPRDAGFILVLQPLLQALCAPVAGRMSDRYEPAWIATAGMALCTFGLGLATMITDSTSFIMVYSILIFMGLGFGFFSTPNSTAIMSSIAPRDYGIASSIIATMRTTGMLTGMTIITILLSYYLGNQPVTPATSKAFVSTMQTAMALFSGMGIVAIFLSMGRVKKLEKR